MADVKASILLPEELRNCVDFVTDSITDDESLLNPVIVIHFLKMLYRDKLDVVEGYINVIEVKDTVRVQEEDERYLVRNNAQDGIPVSSTAHLWVMHKGIIYDPYSEVIMSKQNIPSNVSITYTKSPLIPESQQSPVETRVQLSDLDAELHPAIGEKIKTLVDKYHRYKDE